MTRVMKLAGGQRHAFESASGLPMPGTLAGVLGAPARMLRRWRDARRHRQAMAVLGQLDDRMLRDIGVNRGEIPRVAQYGRTDGKPRRRPGPRNPPAAANSGCPDGRRFA